MNRQTHTRTYIHICRKYKTMLKTAFKPHIKLAVMTKYNSNRATTIIITTKRATNGNQKEDSIP